LYPKYAAPRKRRKNRGTSTPAIIAAVLGADFEDAPTEKGEDGELELEPVVNALPEGVTTG